MKYKLTGTQLVSVEECPYGEKIFKKGQMTGAISASHEWIGDNVLLLSQYISTTKKHIWAKFDTQSMKLIDEESSTCMKSIRMLISSVLPVISVTVKQTENCFFHLNSL